jgi:hypothetical protein
LQLEPYSVAPDRDAVSGFARDGPGFELSVLSGARVGDGQTSVGLGLRSLVDVRGWLLGFHGRVDSYAAPESVPQATLALGVLGGRRFRWRAVALDLIAGPAVVPHESQTVTTGPAEEVSSRSSGAAPRLYSGCHLGFKPRSTLRGFFGVEGDFGPAERVSGDAPDAPPPLPRWMVGLAIGATVGTR